MLLQKAFLAIMTNICSVINGSYSAIESLAHNIITPPHYNTKTSMHDEHFILYIASLT